MQGFRSYLDASFEFESGVNIIVGPNASGKTNLLEAVLYIAGGSSYRAHDADVVRVGSDWARLDGHMVDSSERTVKLQRRGDSVVKTFELDEKKLARLHASKHIPVVLFEPDHLQLLSGPPDMRRNFMDDLIEQSYPDFALIRKNYRRTLMQRNNLLKRNPKGLNEQLFVWNVRLSQLGGTIARRRRELLAACNEQIAAIYSSIAGNEASLTLVYGSKFKDDTYESALLHKLETNIDTEVLRGYTLYGPHRDDMQVELNGAAAESTASRGETRTILLALKVLELQIIEAAREQKPLLLLDDVFSELDGKRRQALTGFVKNYQTFITTTDADLVVQHFTAAAHIIPTSG